MNSLIIICLKDINFHIGTIGNIVKLVPMSYYQFIASISGAGVRINRLVQVTPNPCFPTLGFGLKESKIYLALNSAVLNIS